MKAKRPRTYPVKSRRRRRRSILTSGSDRFYVIIISCLLLVVSLALMRRRRALLWHCASLSIVLGSLNYCWHTTFPPPSALSSYPPRPLSPTMLNICSLPDYIITNNSSRSSSSHMSVFNIANPHQWLASFESLSLGSFKPCRLGERGPPDLHHPTNHNHCCCFCCCCFASATQSVFIC